LGTVTVPDPALRKGVGRLLAWLSPNAYNCITYVRRGFSDMSFLNSVSNDASSQESRTAEKNGDWIASQGNFIQIFVEAFICLIFFVAFVALLLLFPFSGELGSVWMSGVVSITIFSLRRG
jgi:hypothetical protein